jgi:hypothetical protein
MEFIKALFTAQNVAAFITTMLGVFVGFLLSVRQYNKQKLKADNELELKYTLMVKKEMEYSHDAFKVILGNINNFLSENELLDKDGKIKDIKEDWAKEEKAKDLFITGVQYLESMISDRALSSASRAGSTKAISLDEVIDAYYSYNVYISKVKPDSDNLQRGLRYRGPNILLIYCELLIRLRDYCIQLDKNHQKGINKLEELEKTLR